MPLPPAAVFLGGPAAMAAAKAVAYEYGGAISSASLAALLARSAWNRIPDWIKEDVSFGGKGKNKSDSGHGDDASGRGSSTGKSTSTSSLIQQEERLSSVLEKVHAWIQEAATKWSDPPVPYVYAALLIYFQLCMAYPSLPLMMGDASVDEDKNEDEKNNSHPHEKIVNDDESSSTSKKNRSSAFFVTDDEDTDANTLSTLKEMSELATASYYIDDETELCDLLEAKEYYLLRTFIPTRPGFVGYYMAESKSNKSSPSSSSSSSDTTANTTERTLLIGIKGTTSLEELLTDVCGKSVSYLGAVGGQSEMDSCESCRIEVHAKQGDRVVFVNNSNNTTTSTSIAATSAASDGAGVGVDETPNTVKISLSFNQEEQKLQDDDRYYEQQDEVEVISGHERVCIEDDQNNIIDVHASVLAAVQDDDASYNHVRCHEGILLSAQRLLVQIQDVLDEYVPAGYRILLVGHSLGASAASLLAMLLRSRYPELCEYTNGSLRNSSSSNSGNGISPNPHRRRLQAYAFGSPPVMDHDSAVAASSYVTSILNQSDLIARSSTSNLGILLECLRTISEQVLIPNDLAPIGPTSCLQLWKQLRSGDPLWTQDELVQAMEEAQMKVELRHPDHLYVPGKLYYIQKRYKSLRKPDDDTDSSPLNLGTTTKIAASATNNDGSSSPASEKSCHSYRYTCHITDVTSAALRVIYMNGFQMLGDHTIVEYQAALDALLVQKQQQQNQQ